MNFLEKYQIYNDATDCHVIYQGEIFVTNKPMVIKTLLGSCISVCLYDPVSKVIGMNHFMIAKTNKPFELICNSDLGRYGIFSMEVFINKMVACGAERKELCAKVFGGASVLEKYDENRSLNIAEDNCCFIHKYLNIEQIPIVSSFIGGKQGMIIYFCQQDFSVYVRKIRKENVLSKIISNEHLLSKPTQNKFLNTANVEIWDE